MKNPNEENGRGLCLCGCGSQLLGGRTKWATDKCFRKHYDNILSKRPQKLSVEETENLEKFETRNKKYKLVKGIKTELSEEFIQELDSLNESESFLVPFKDWNFRSLPLTSINRFYKSFNNLKQFKSVTVRSRDSWLIVRVS